MAGAAPSPLAGRVLAGRRVSAGTWALDAGCGTGRAFAALGQTGCRVIGLDPVMEGLRASRARAGSEGVEASLVRGIASALPLCGGSIRLALSVGVLFHLGPRELPAALAEIHRVLAPSGEAILHFLDLGDWAAQPRRRDPARPGPNARL